MLLLEAATLRWMFGECMLVARRVNEPIGPGIVDTAGKSRFHKLPGMVCPGTGKCLSSVHVRSSGHSGRLLTVVAYSRSDANCLVVVHGLQLLLLTKALSVRKRFLAEQVDLMSHWNWGLLGW